MTEKQFKMSIARTKVTGIILEKELSTDEVYAILMDYKNENEQLKSENQRLEKLIEELNYELTEIKQSEEDNYNITDGLW